MSALTITTDYDQTQVTITGTRRDLHNLTAVAYGCAFKGESVPPDGRGTTLGSVLGHLHTWFVDYDHSFLSRLGQTLVPDDWSGSADPGATVKSITVPLKST